MKTTDDFSPFTHPWLRGVDRGELEPVARAYRRRQEIEGLSTGVKQTAREMLPSVRAGRKGQRSAE